MDIPKIEPVPAGAPRPFWSVMIPAYNCARYLRQTLTSVLAQAPGPDQMQIEVVDDGSTLDDPAAVVREWGQGRVAFHRNAQNQGVTKNFNVCLQRSRGHLVHILHGDDYVLPGFYQRIKTAAEENPQAALLATRSFDIDADNVILHVAPRLRDLETAAHAVESFFYTTPIQTPGVVMRRDFYEQHGGFDLRLAHTADCEMWARAIGLAGGCVLPDVLAYYRTFPGNDSGHLARTAGNLHDIERLNQIFAARYPAFDPKKGARRVWHTARQQIRHFNRQRDAAALTANLLYWQTQVPWAFRLRNFFRLKTNR